MRSAPDKCPVCGAEQFDHTPETADDFAWWHYDCGAEIIRATDGKLYSEEECGFALDSALKKLNEEPEQQPVSS